MLRHNVFTQIHCVYRPVDPTHGRCVVVVVGDVVVVAAAAGDDDDADADGMFSEAILCPVAPVAPVCPLAPVNPEVIRQLWLNPKVTEET